MTLFLFAVQQGTPTDDELEELGRAIAEDWKRLGRNLRIADPRLHYIQRTYNLLSERGYHMLKHWKLKKGSAATYQALCDALKHEHVQREDLAEQFCNIHPGNYLLPGEGEGASGM